MIGHYLVLSAAMFSIGAYGVLARRNLLIILMSVELMLNGVNIALLAFARVHAPAAGGSGSPGHVFETSASLCYTPTKICRPGARPAAASPTHGVVTAALLSWLGAGRCSGVAAGVGATPGGLTRRSVALVEEYRGARSPLDCRTDHRERREGYRR